MSTLEVRVRDDERVRWITLDRPASRNGLTIETNRIMLEALEEAAARAELRVVVLSGASGSFSSGLDLKQMLTQGIPEDLEAQGRKYFLGLIRAIRRLPKPVVALVDGAAAGYGCDLALACDLRVGTERARFGEVFVRRGLMPDGGGTYLLPRLVGLGKAMELLLLGDVVDADEALRLGLLNRIVPSAEAEAACQALAVRLAKGPPLVHARVKAAVNAGLTSDLDTALDNELAGQLQLLRSRDFVEGVGAFLGKREPEFKGE
jgi:enoyl-CoA hydratase/carnithine racemase